MSIETEWNRNYKYWAEEVALDYQIPYDKNYEKVLKWGMTTAAYDILSEFVDDPETYNKIRKKLGRNFGSLMKVKN